MRGVIVVGTSHPDEIVEPFFVLTFEHILHFCCKIEFEQLIDLNKYFSFVHLSISIWIEDIINLSVYHGMV